MINQPVYVALFLIFLIAFITFVSEYPRTKHLFKFLPSVFWMYFLPMLASTFGIISMSPDLYTFVTLNFLPASLFLLLLSSDIPAIIKLGKPALIMMFAGSFGIVVGTPIVFLLCRHWIGGDFWAGFGALAASWTGGSANMIAVKEALRTPDSVFLPMVIVDTIVPYLWMGFLIAFAGFQIAYDRFNRSDRRILDELSKKAKNDNSASKHKFDLRIIALIFTAAFVVSISAQFLSKMLPEAKDIISSYAWMIIAASSFGIAASFTRAKKLEGFGASKVGYFFLYFVLAAIGAKANLLNIGSTLVLIFAGIILVCFHAVILLIVSRLIRAPMFLVAVASQANIGGVASTPIVASIYQPGLATVGLLLAILGNIMGTYFGILSGHLCHLVSH